MSREKEEEDDHQDFFYRHLYSAVMAKGHCTVMIYIRRSINITVNDLLLLLFAATYKSLLSWILAAHSNSSFPQLRLHLPELLPKDLVYDNGTKRALPFPDDSFLQDHHSHPPPHHRRMWSLERICAFALLKMIRAGIGAIDDFITSIRYSTRLEFCWSFSHCLACVVSWMTR